jgi:hypothetical protein
MENNNKDEATNLAKAAVTSLTVSIFTLGQQLLGAEPATAIALGFVNMIASSAIEYGAKDLTRSERRRTGQMGLLMLREIESHLQRKHTPRTDGFLTADPGGRSSAHELCEALLEVSRSEHQEDKLPYIGYLYVSVLFTDRVSIGEANRLFRIAKSVTYRQMCLLVALLSNELESRHSRIHSHSQEEGSDELSSMIQECYELEGWGLLSQVDHGQIPFQGTPSWVYVVPANLRVTAYGKRLMELSRLTEIPEAHTLPIRETLRA